MFLTTADRLLYTMLMKTHFRSVKQTAADLLWSATRLPVARHRGEDVLLDVYSHIQAPEKSIDLLDRQGERVSD